MDRHFELKNVKRVYFLLHHGFSQVHITSSMNTSLLFIFSSDPFMLIEGCARSRWLSTLPYISWKRVKVFNKGCIGAGKRTFNTLCRRGDPYPIFYALIKGVICFCLTYSVVFIVSHFPSSPTSFLLSHSGCYHFPHLLTITKRENM